MKTQKHTHYFLFLILVLLFTVPFSTALGIAPAKREISFQPDFEKEFTGIIVNQERKEMTVLLRENDPYDILSIREESITFSEGEYEKMFSYTVYLAEDLSAYGELASIQAQEQSDAVEGNVQTILVVESKIIILAPVEVSPSESSLALEQRSPEEIQNTLSLSEKTDSFPYLPLLLFFFLFLLCFILLSTVLRNKKEKKKRKLKKTK